MSDKAERTLIVRFMDGTEQMFNYPAQGGDAATMAERLQEALKANNLTLEVEGRLILIPFQSVKTIEVSPSPEKLPPNVLRSVTFAP